MNAITADYRRALHYGTNEEYLWLTVCLLIGSVHVGVSVYVCVFVYIKGFREVYSCL